MTSCCRQAKGRGHEGYCRPEGRRTVQIMDARWILFVTFAANRVFANHDGPLCFDKNFVFGVATASYQIEGAWNVSGKGESIWDRYTHTHPERVFDHTSGDVADDSYHRFRDDIGLLKDLGVQFYRFSISWPRILPDGFSNKVNAEGVKYYKDLIVELRQNGIIPLVTMYHWDLPQSLQDLGGWTNPIVAEYFVDYARVLFDNFGHLVHLWLTFNEPTSFCGDGYGGDDAPGGRASGLEDYLCGHHVLLAHGRVYRMYREHYQETQQGLVGITLCIDWNEPASTSEEDKVAAETANQFTFGWFANPIFSAHGDYPAVMRKRVDEISREQGFFRSRLPSFTREELESIQGSFDFIGVNHYTSHMVRARRGGAGSRPSFTDDMGVTMWQRDDWPKTNSTWLRVVPWGFRKALNWIRTTYSKDRDLMMIITENGVSTVAGLRDAKRVQYIAAYLKALHGAMQDGCIVAGYAYWSLLDNYEWMRGYSERFGLYEVDYSSPNRTRTARLSAKFYTQLAKTRCIPEDYLDLEYTVNMA